MKNLESIITKLPALTQGELAQVRAAVDQLINTKQARGVDPTVLVWDALMKALNTKISFAAMHDMSIYKQWKQHAPACLEFVEGTFPEVKRSKVTEMAVIQFLLEALRDNLRAGRIPITVGTMVTHMGRVPQVFEKAFPNYLESGLTELVLKAMNKKGQQ